MLLVETEPIKAVVRLILREPAVSNFCKSWLYLKAMVENDANIRIQLENGYNHWDFEGGMEQTFTFYPDWFAIDRKNKLSKQLIAKDFYRFIQFYVETTFRNSFFSVVNYPVMGLGIRNTNRIRVDDFGDEINGYLEFIDMDLFHAFHQLGYNSLFTYVDSKREKQYCNSDPNRDVSFTWLNRDGLEHLYENRFEEVHLREVLYPNTPDEMEVEECRVRFSQRVFHYTCENYYSYRKYIQHKDCELPVTKRNSKIELLVAIQLEYVGRRSSPHRASEFFEAGEHIRLDQSKWTELSVASVIFCIYCKYSIL
jgi:hypothetical protein